MISPRTVTASFMHAFNSSIIALTKPFIACLTWGIFSLTALLSPLTIFITKSNIAFTTLGTFVLIAFIIATIMSVIALAIWGIDAAILFKTVRIKFNNVSLTKFTMVGRFSFNVVRIATNTLNTASTSCGVSVAREAITSDTNVVTASMNKGMLAITTFISAVNSWVSALSIAAALYPSIVIKLTRPKAIAAAITGITVANDINAAVMERPAPTTDPDSIVIPADNNISAPPTNPAAKPKAAKPKAIEVIIGMAGASRIDAPANATIIPTIINKLLHIDSHDISPNDFIAPDNTNIAPDNISKPVAIPIVFLGIKFNVTANIPNDAAIVINPWPNTLRSILPSIWRTPVNSNNAPLNNNNPAPIEVMLPLNPLIELVNRDSSINAVANTRKPCLSVSIFMFPNIAKTPASISNEVVRGIKLAAILTEFPIPLVEFRNSDNPANTAAIVTRLFNIVSVFRLPNIAMAPAKTYKEPLISNKPVPWLGFISAPSIILTTANKATQAAPKPTTPLNMSSHFRPDSLLRAEASMLNDIDIPINKVIVDADLLNSFGSILLNAHIAPVMIVTDAPKAVTAGNNLSGSTLDKTHIDAANIPIDIAIFCNMSALRFFWYVSSVPCNSSNTPMALSLKLPVAVKKFFKNGINFFITTNKLANKPALTKSIACIFESFTLLTIESKKPRIFSMEVFTKSVKSANPFWIALNTPTTKFLAASKGL